MYRTCLALIDVSIYIGFLLSTMNNNSFQLITAIDALLPTTHTHPSHHTSLQYLNAEHPASLAHRDQTPCHVMIMCNVHRIE